MLVTCYRFVWLKTGVSRDDVRWLLGRLGRLSDEQLRAGLTASGATVDEREKYVKALRMRIGALQKVVAE